MLKRYSFSKRERLSTSKTIHTLFNSGNTSVLYPLKVFWMEENEITVPVRVIINVSSKLIKKASKRNLIRRSIREAYRVNKHLLYKKLESAGKSIILAYIYISPDVIQYEDIEKLLKRSFKVILDDLV